VRNPELSKRLARIITRSMSLDPAQRFKDLREMGRELLFLAGQRTRITWGLSFGDVRPATSGGPLTEQQPARLNGAAALVPPWRKYLAPGLSAAGVLAVLFLLFSVFTRQDVPAGQAPIPAEAVPQTNRTQTVNAAQPEAAPPAVGAQQPPLPTAAPEATASSAPKARRSRATQGQPAARSSYASNGAVPEWDVPQVQAGASQGKPAEGRRASSANGAPIFD
jgi:hypothetical protein